MTVIRLKFKYGTSNLKPYLRSTPYILEFGPDLNPYCKGTVCSIGIETHAHKLYLRYRNTEISHRIASQCMCGLHLYTFRCLISILTFSKGSSNVLPNIKS